MKTLSKYAVAVLGIVIVVLLASKVSLHFGYTDREKKDTVQAIGEFHRNFNDDEFDEIYKSTDTILQQSRPREALLALMGKTKANWGKVHATDCTEINVIVEAPVRIEATCHSSFDSGDGKELFRFIRRGSKLHLLSYEIHSIG